MEGILNVKSSSGNLSRNEIQEVLEDILNREDLNNLIEDKLLRCADTISEERKMMFDSLNREAGWLERVKNLSIGSWDLLAIKILWPV